MNEPATCGKGLAERSVLPARLSSLSAAMADILERHQQTLDLTDDNAGTELDAYRVLARDYRAAASHLRATAERMAGYRDLPMARHDVRALSGAENREALANLIARERDLVALLENWIDRDQTMLAGMSGQAST